jgi:putative ABC transport system permease protein
MLWEMILLATRSIRRNLLRSFLTILGIVIGVAAVIAMVTLGQGVTAQVAKNISSLGTNLLNVAPGQGMRGPGGARATGDPFEIEDAVAIQRDIPGVSAVAPVASRRVQAIQGNENWSTSVIGSDNGYMEVRNFSLASGRQFNASEIRGGKAVCILGETVRKELYGDQNPLGTFVRLEKLSCKVIGVFAPKGQSSFGSDQDDFVLIPLRAFQRRVAGNRDVSGVYVSARDGVSTEKMERDIIQLLRERRKILPGEDDDFHVHNMKELVSTLTGTTRLLTALLGAVAAVSLLVGGIGIMNIMLVSVTERTREIGIRLAIGALEREVMIQFLVEAVVLSSFGGLVGIALGLSAAAAGANALRVPFIFNWQIVTIAFAFSGGVGVVFGYFPAQKAARLNPIEALRYE